MKNFRKMSHSAEKCKGGIWDLKKYILLQNNEKLEGGTLWEHSHSAGKKSKGGLFSPVRFCRLRLKVKNERGTLWTKFA